jgi:phosphohistidine phosphatase SixA
VIAGARPGSGSLRVRPPWEQPQSPSSELHEIVIDPGQAFGTGGHPTTRLCLELLLALAAGERQRGTLLDVGTGSGVLAIAAALLGFAPVLALDNDPMSLDAARSNASQNGVEIQTIRLTRARAPRQVAHHRRARNGPRARPAGRRRQPPARPLLELAGAFQYAPRELIASGLLERPRSPARSPSARHARARAARKRSGGAVARCAVRAPSALRERRGRARWACPTRRPRGGAHSPGDGSIAGRTPSSSSSSPSAADSAAVVASASPTSAGSGPHAATAVSIARACSIAPRTAPARPGSRIRTRAGDPTGDRRPRLTGCGSSSSRRSSSWPSSRRARPRRLLTKPRLRATRSASKQGRCRQPVGVRPNTTRSAGPARTADHVERKKQEIVQHAGVLGHASQDALVADRAVGERISTTCGWRSEVDEPPARRQPAPGVDQDRDTGVSVSLKICSISGCQQGSPGARGAA